MNNKKFFKDFLSFGLISSISKFSMILLLPLYVTNLELLEYGRLEFLLLLIAIFSTFFRFALPTTLSRFYFKEDFCAISIYFVFIVISSLLIISAVLCIYFIDVNSFFGFETPNGTLLHVVLISFFSGFNNIAQMHLRMEDRIAIFRNSIIIQVMLNTILVLSIYFLMILNVGNIIVCTMLSVMASSLYLLFKLKLLYLRNSEWKLNFIIYFKFAISFFPATFSNIVNANIIRLMIVFLFGNSMFTLYSFALRVSSVIQFITDALIKAWQRISMSKLDVEVNGDVFYQMMLMKSYKLGVLLFLMVVLFVTPLAFFIPGEYKDSIVILPLICAAYLVHPLMNILQVGLVKNNRMLLLSFCTYSSVIVSVISMSALSFFSDDIIVAGISIFLSEVFLVVLVLYFNNKCSDFSFRIDGLLFYVCTLLVGNLLFVYSCYN